MFTRVRWAIVTLALSAGQASALDHDIGERIDAYLNPYVQSGNFSGAVLIEKHGHIVFQRAYGFADREHRVQNTKATRFHIASVSMQFTAAAVLRLVDEGSIRLDTTVGNFLPGIVGGEKITVRDLLIERSGLPDINDLPDYSDVLQSHQTPATLVAKIAGRPLLFVPGSRFLHEEHSAYNVLALILEKKTGLPFAAAVERLVFHPAGLVLSGVDDESIVPEPDVAIGYEPEAVSGLRRAPTIHWSAKTGNASVYTTVTDEARFVAALFTGHLLSASSRKLLRDPSPRVGYGWFRGVKERFGDTAYYMNGRAPGFASFVLYLPREQTTVVCFSNIYSSATTTIGYDIAAIALGLPHTPFQPSGNALTARELKACTGRFQFGPDFYQPNAHVELLANGPELSLRWPSADISPLIPLGRDHFVDRSYWEEIRIERDGTGRPITLVYGRFRGTAVNNPQ